jgi:hypothetical protein
MRIRLTAFGILIAVGTLMLSTLVVTQPASAAELKTACGPWGQEAFWRTSTKWAHVSQRSCLDWYNYENQVRARGELRIDWPVMCTLTDCATTMLKGQEIEFRSAEIAITWNMSGRQGSRNCDYGDMRFGWSPTSPAKFIQCSSDWMTHPVGTYVTRMASMADVANDGEGYKVLTANDAFGLTFG